MTNFIIYISIGVIVGFVAYKVLYSDCKVDVEKVNQNELRAEEKEDNKKKILDLLEREGKIRNDMVEEFLGVSDSSVGRYLDELEQEGKIKQIGNTGIGVYYIKA